MVTLKEAFQNAQNSISEIYGDEVIDIRLEEVDLDPSGEFWDLVISFLIPEKNPPSHTPLTALTALQTRKFERLYKKIIIKQKNGEVSSIKIYKNE